MRPAGGIHVAARQRRDAREALEEVERGAFGRQHRARRPVDSSATSPAAQRSPSCGRVNSPRDRAAGRSRPPRRARRDALALGQDHAPRRQRGIHRGLGRDVAPAEVLGQRPPHGLAVERRDRAGPKGTVFIAGSPPRRPLLGERQFDGSDRVAAVTNSNARRPRPSGGRSRPAAAAPARRTRPSDDGAARCGPSADACRATSAGGSRRARRWRASDARASASAAVSRSISPCVGPGGGVHRARLPPRPDFLGGKRQVRREQAQHDRERAQQRARWPSRPPRAVVAVAARLHHLEVVVAERPEERLGRRSARA
jgi:hypothetical protein